MNENLDDLCEKHLEYVFIRGCLEAATKSFQLLKHPHEKLVAFQHALLIHEGCQSTRVAPMLHVSINRLVISIQGLSSTPCRQE